jgi:ADP-ribosylglycohydrolase
MDTRADRALAAFRGLALGDALGMPTQSMSRAEIRADYGAITGLLPAGPRQRIAAGMPAGRITDDTEQAVLLARLLVEGHGTVDIDRFAHSLLAWEAEMAARGSLDLLGPSTKTALQRFSQGVPAGEAGRYGTTNGAAMRITPIGIAFSLTDPVANPLADPVVSLQPGFVAFIDVVAATSAPTHNTGLGIAAAVAVGAAVSAGIAGATQAEAVEVAIAAADEGAGRGYWAAGAQIGPRLRWAVPYLASLVPEARADAVYRVIGTSVASQESVVAALALAACSEDPWQTLCLAAGLGGDTDTIAAMTGAVLGATHGTSVWPAAAWAMVQEVNGLDLEPLVHDLLALRTAAEHTTWSGRERAKDSAVSQAPERAMPEGDRG